MRSTRPSPGRPPRQRPLLTASCLLTLALSTGCPGHGAGGQDAGPDADVTGWSLSPDPVGMVPGATRTVTVRRPDPADQAVTLPLSVEDEAVAQVASTVTLPAGETSASFAVQGVALGTTTLHVGPLAATVMVVTVDETCVGAADGTLEEGGQVAVSRPGPLAGAAVVAPDDQHATPLTPRQVSISCAEDIAPAGFLPVGPAVRFDIAGGLLEKWVEVTLPWRSALLPDHAHTGNLRVAVKLRGYPAWTAPVPNIWPEAHPTDGRLTFRYDEGATFQVVVPETAGQPVGRRFTYRAVLGFSMGGGGAGSVGLRNPDRFDFVVQNGGEPGIDMIYSLQVILDYLLGGFCTAADEAGGAGLIGELCPPKRKVLTRQFERPSTFEHWIFEPYAGTYIYLRREFYLRATRDLVRAFGNPFFYNPDSAVLPPGVPASFLSEPSPCDHPVVLHDFYNRDYNPTGTYPVITFCDASESEDSTALGIGVFDPSLPKTNPVYAVLAVDVNGNGRRDSGEPVITMGREPFEDVGTDGVPDASEVGYDPVTNPDPAGDDYHWLKNPTGTEGNWRYDEGEPFEDAGLDGVSGAGCEVGSGTPGCYDHGEGNGVFDRAPGWDAWLAHGSRSLYAALSAEQQANLTVWSDSGIRDFFNCHVSTNQFVGQQAAQGENVRTFFGFQRMVNDPVSLQNFDFQRVDFERLSRHVYVLYGDPDATEAMIEQGDGRHVGTALQVIYRLNTPMAFLSRRWPGGDYTLENDDHPYEDHFLGADEPLTFTASNGRVTPYALYLPPGYYLDKNQDLHYPVVYFLHGYGQSPDDLIAASGVFENYMISENISPRARYQKMIIVYVDGRCRPGGRLGTTSGGYHVWSDLGADACEQGTFYADSPTGSAAQAEAQLLELMDLVDATYRTKPAETLDVIE